MGCMGAYASVGMIIVMLGMDLSPTSFTFDDLQRKAPDSEFQKLGCANYKYARNAVMFISLRTVGNRYGFYQRRRTATTGYPTPSEQRKRQKKAFVRSFFSSLTTDRDAYRGAPCDHRCHRSE
jgi:hypothetical protein